MLHRFLPPNQGNFRPLVTTKSASVYECGRFTCTIKQHLGQMPPKHVAGLPTQVVNDKGRNQDSARIHTSISIPRYPVLPITARTSVSSRWPPSPRARSLLAPPLPDKTSPLLYRCGSIAVRHTSLFLYLQTRRIGRSGDNPRHHARLLPPEPLVVTQPQSIRV